MPRTPRPDSIPPKRRRRQSRAAKLVMAQPKQIDENGSLIIIERDGGERKIKITNYQEDQNIDVVPIIYQGNIAISL